MEPTLVERLQRAAPGRVSRRALQKLSGICVIAALAVALLAAPAFAESARSLYNKGRNAEARQSYEAAYEYCKAAYDKDPKNIRYRAEYERTRFYAAMVKVHRGQLLRNQGKNEEALAEFQNAQTIAPALDIAQQEIDVRTFYLSNISQPTDLQDVVNALRTVIELQRIQQLPSQNAIVIRGTPDQLALAEKLIGDIDKPKPEVVIDVAVMQVSRNKERDLGILPATNVSVALTNQSFQNLGSTTTGTGTTGTGTTGTGTNQQQPGGQVTF